MNTLLIILSITFFMLLSFEVWSIHKLNVCRQKQWLKFVVLKTTPLIEKNKFVWLPETCSFKKAKIHFFDLKGQL